MLEGFRLLGLAEILSITSRCLRLKDCAFQKHACDLCQKSFDFYNVNPRSIDPCHELLLNFVCLR